MWINPRDRGRPCPAAADATTTYAPSGYAQLLTGTSLSSPALPPRLSSPAPLLNSGVPAAEITKRSGYIPASAPSGIVGGGLFGGGAIGHRVPFHGQLVPTVVDGFTVYEPAPGGDQRK